MYMRSPKPDRRAPVRAEGEEPRHSGGAGGSPDPQTPERVREEIREYIYSIEYKLMNEIKRMFKVYTCREAHIQVDGNYYVVGYYTENITIDDDVIPGVVYVTKHYHRDRATLYEAKHDYIDRNGYHHTLAKIDILVYYSRSTVYCYQQTKVDVRPLLADMTKDLLEANEGNGEEAYGAEE